MPWSLCIPTTPLWLSWKNKAELRCTRKRNWWPRAFLIRLWLYKFPQISGTDFATGVRRKFNSCILQTLRESINGVTSHCHKACFMLWRGTVSTLGFILSSIGRHKFSCLSGSGDFYVVLWNKPHRIVVFAQTGTQVIYTTFIEHVKT